MMKKYPINKKMIIKTNIELLDIPISKERGFTATFGKFQT